MPKCSGEYLSKYVAAVINERGLDLGDVQRRSNGAIKRAYVSKIMNGKTKTPSIDKVKALALGLGVDEDEIFLVARGAADPEAAGRRSAFPLPVLELLKAIEKVIISPELTALVHLAVRLSSEDRHDVLDFARRRLVSHKQPTSAEDLTE